MNLLSTKDISTIINHENIREAKLTDIEQLALLMSKEWRLGYKQAQCSRYYTSMCYAHRIYASSQYMFVYVDENDKAMGFVGYANKHLQQQFETKKEYHNQQYEKMVRADDAGIPGELIKYYKHDNGIEQQQHGISDNYLEIFIVDESYRGKNIANQLMDIVFKCIKRLRVLNPTINTFNELSIYTTDSCTYQYYDKIGCEKIIEYHDDFDDDTIYIYKIKVDD